MTIQKLVLPVILAFIGFIFSTRHWLLFLNQLNPFIGLLVYYMIITITILILQFFGLIIAGITFDSLSHTIGTILIIFSFFLVCCWESCWVAIVTKGTCDGTSNVILQSEDGACYYMWSLILGDKNIELLHILTYVITPFVLTLIGQFLITSKIIISPF